MSTYVVHEGWRYEVRPFVRTTAQMVFYAEGGRERRRTITDLVAVLPEASALDLAEQLTSARAECQQRVRAANEWLAKRKAELVSIAKARGEA